MKQGIRLFFVNNPIEGDRLSFEVKVNNIRIVYLNSLDVVDFEFTENESEVTSDPLHRVLIGSTIDETLVNLKYFFESNNFYVSSFPILYNDYYDSPIRLDIIYDTSEPTVTNDIITNDNLQYNSFGIPDIPETIKQRYFMEYKNIVGDAYTLRILNNGFTGESRTIYGKILINKNEIKNHFDPIRGTGLTIEIEADETFKFDELYAVNEMDFPVRLEKNNAIIYNGYLSTENAFQSYVNDKWIISLDCVDGLGFLENLSFVDSNGFPFSGKISCLEAIKNCLNRTKFSLRINTYVNVYYDGLELDAFTDILSKTYLNTERFLKSDDNTIMSCREVLISILKIFKAVITQEHGEWFIYRPSDIYQEPNPKILYYTNELVPSGWRQFVLTKKFGSQIDNYYPHHCSGNQRLEVRNAIAGFRLNYKYGFIGSFLENGKLNHPVGTTNYSGWIFDGWDESDETGYLVIDPISTSGMSFIAGVPEPYPATVERRRALESLPIDVLEGFSFEIKFRAISYGYPAYIIFRVFLSGVTSLYEMKSNGDWSLISGGIRFFTNNGREGFTASGDLTEDKYDRTISIKTAQIPEDGELFVLFDVPLKTVQAGKGMLVEVKSFEVINTFEGNNIIGEFHTVTRTNPLNSNLKENESVYMGDSGDPVYLGALYKEDQESLTDLWHRKGKQESLPILRISAEDELRIAQVPTKIFSGDTYGQIPYFSVFEINNISGKFLPISYSYDTKSNISNIKLLEIYYNELSNIKYEKTNDYGETVKPTIVG